MEISYFRSKASRGDKVHLNTCFGKIFSKLEIFDVFISQQITLKSFFLGDTFSCTKGKGTRKKTHLQNEDIPLLVIKEVVQQTIKISKACPGEKIIIRIK